MITFPQLEALVWIARLGTFERAANRINTTQPTVTKRIRELSISCGFDVFEKRGRSVRLTPKGELLAQLSEEALALRARMRSLVETAEPRPKVTIGATELSAQTWLPRYFRHIRKSRPDLHLDVAIQKAQSLLEALETDDIDLAICRRLPHSKRLKSKPLTRVPMAWIASGTTERDIRDKEVLTRMTLINQGQQGGSGDLFGDWYREQGLRFERVVQADSMAAVIGLVLADCGLSILPTDFVAPDIRARRLIQLNALPTPPEIEFNVYVRQIAPSPIVLDLANEAKAFCDFSQIHQT